MPVSDDDEQILSAIHQNHLVGFAVQKPRGFFSVTGHLGFEGFDLMEYQDERLWLSLQDQDPEVWTTDDDATKILLVWRIFFRDSAANQTHLSTVGVDLEVIYVFSCSYVVVFEDQNQERHYLLLSRPDPSVTAVYPERERQAIFYDEVEGKHPEPYTANVVIHEVRIRLARSPS
ncbi:hypothetical protein KCU98_g1291, partial [Aureobasidium melanogenum]